MYKPRFKTRIVLINGMLGVQDDMIINFFVPSNARKKIAAKIRETISIFIFYILQAETHQSIIETII